MANKQKENIMKILGVSEAEADEILAYDKEVDKMTMAELNATMTAEEKAVVKSMTKSERKPTVYNFKQRERKANPTKGSIIAEIAKFLTENSENACENVTITNKERQIAFKIGENDYEITLIQKRKPKN